MAISASAVWRARPSGNNANGSGYDATISGAGTDYSQQDTAQLSLTDLAAVANSTTLTSATGGFTAAMIGNAIQISAGTNIVAGFYFITARASSTSVTLDRTPTTSGNAMSAATGKVGGGVKDLTALFGGSQTSTSSVQPGNSVYIRGSGSNTPTPGTGDYSYGTTAQAINFSGTATKLIRLIGENGRPNILGGQFTMTYFTLENLVFTAPASYHYSAFVTLTKGRVSNSKFDCGGNGDPTSLFTSCMILLSEFCNSTVTGSDTSYFGNPAKFQMAKCTLFGCYIHGNTNVSGTYEPFMQLSDNYGGCVAIGCIIANNYGPGFAAYQSNRGFAIIIGCVFYNNTLYGLAIGVADLGDSTGTVIQNSLFVGHTGTGNAGVGVTDGSFNPATYTDFRAFVARNYFYNNTASLLGITADTALDITLASDPFVASASGNFQLKGAGVETDAFPVLSGIVAQPGALALGLSLTSAEIYHVS